MLIAQRKKLRANLAYLEQELKSNKELIFNVNYPVIYLKNDNVFESLLKEKIVIARFKYPTYTGYMNRIVITANHSFEDIKKLVEVLNRA